MALTVSEIMNREVFSVGPAESVDATRAAILALGITGVPVVNEGGKLVLLHGGAGVAERVLWAESSESVRDRLKQMLTTVQPGLLGAWLAYGGLRFRAASAPDPAERSDALTAALRGVAVLLPDLVAGASR